MLHVAKVKMDELMIAQRFFDTLRLEIRGLQGILDVDPTVVTGAVELILGISGKVVVTGMGKSGIVGQKIASTFTSTGTPAIFVHPAEASHGDLGSIARDDLIIMLSNSGETQELFDMIRFAQVRKIPIIGFTRAADSALAQTSTLAVVVPPVEEACPHLLAPTTSTTQMLAVGDALAVAVMEVRGFTPGDFAQLHPGGKLGRLLAKTGEIMHTGDEVPIVVDTVNVKDAISAMMDRRFGCIGVTDGTGRLTGLVSNGDLRRHLDGDLLHQNIQKVMTRSPFTVGPEMSCLELIETMNRRRIIVVFVVDDDHRPLGIIEMHDLVRLRM